MKLSLEPSGNGELGGYGAQLILKLVIFSVNMFINYKNIEYYTHYDPNLSKTHTHAGAWTAPNFSV